MLTESTARQPKQSGFIQAFVKYREAGIVLSLLVLAVVVSLRNPAFLSLNNLRDIVLNISILLIVALGQSMVIMTRGIDLSVGSMIGLTAMMVAFVMAAFPTMPPLLMIPLGMALGAALEESPMKAKTACDKQRYE